VRVVSNAGPLIALGKLGQLGLLARLFDEVWIPLGVYEEVVAGGMRLGAPDAYLTQRMIEQGSIRVMSVDVSDDDPWMQYIDIGEVEVIALAKREGVAWTLIDEVHAREIAREEGLPIKGTLGVIVEALRQSLLTIQEFEVLIAEIKARPDIWISEHLCNQVLQQVRRDNGRS